jgi:hypothetical protein
LCHATQSGAALAAAGPALSTWQHVLRHSQRRRIFLSSATVNGAAKKGYSSEKKFTEGLFLKIVSSLGYFCLNCPSSTPTKEGCVATRLHM